MKKLFSKVYRKVTLAVGRLFFDRYYLDSKWFYESSFGCRWIWRSIRHQIIGKENRHISWPVSHQITINGPKENIVFSPESIDDFQGKGIYYQCEKAKIVIGKGTLIANNVGIITANHDPTNIDRHLDGEDVIIGENCWIGINSVLLPGVHLGDCTIVGAGSVVTKSFPEGNCVVVGNPARKLRDL